MQKLSLCLSVIFCFLTLFTACKSTNSVELFRVNENGEVVNIGRSADEGHVIYGHFRDPVRYDRAASTLMRPTGNSAICHILVNDGQTNEGKGVSIRLDPCADIYIVNEGKITSSLDDIGLFYHSVSGSQGLYQLNVFDGKDYQKKIERNVSDDLWKSADILKKLEDGSLQLQYSGDEGTVTEILAAADVLAGNCLTPRPVAAAVPEADPVPESTPDAESTPDVEPAPDAE